MKKLIVVILSLLLLVIVLAVLIGGCMNTDIKRHKDGGYIYHGNRYVASSFYNTELEYYGRSTEILRLHYENPEFVGTYFVMAWGLLPTNLKFYFSEFDTEKNILFRRGDGIVFIWVREGFELPDPYECRVNRINIRTGYRESGALVWEAEQEFLTLNDMIGEKTTPCDNPIYRDSHSIELNFFLEDYGYLYITHVEAFCYNDKVYLRIMDRYYYIVTDEYAEIFKEAIALSDS